MKRSISFCGGTLLVALPLVALATGCGGGNGGGIGTPTATPTGTTTPTATTAPTPIALGSAPVSFGNGQTGTITLSQTGNTISGNIMVNPAVVSQGRKTRALSFIIPAGTYPISGTINPLASPITFNVTGNFPAPVGQFSISGSLPTITTAGTYTLTAAGQTVNGTYPALGSIIPTATPTGGATPTPTTPVGIGGSFNLTLTQTADSTFGLTSFQPNAISGTRSSSGQVSVGANYNSGTPVQSRTFALNLFSTTPPIKVGDTFNVAVLPNLLTLGGISSAGVINWGASGGTVEVTAISNTSISAKFTNVTLSPSVATPAAKGTLTLNGTIQANLAPA